MRKLNQRGSFIVFLTLGFALLGTIIGFALDFGRAYLEKARIARLIDGAALAAAKVLKGQPALESSASRAACDSMLMNGAQVTWNQGASTCSTTGGAPLTATVTFFDLAVAGGPPLRAVRIVGSEAVPTTFLRFLGWMVPGDYSKINVVAQAEAGPERPVDLMLVLDRSGSMSCASGCADGSGTLKLTALKTAVNGFLGLQNTFSASDRIGLVSFATRGCGNAGVDTAANTCVPDKALDFATTSYLSTLQIAVTALVGGGGTNTMEAIRTARAPLANAFADSTRASTRKAVLLVTDGQPTFMIRDDDSACKHDPKTGASLPNPGNTNTTGGPFTNGCKQGVSASRMLRQPYSNISNAGSAFTSIGGATEYLNTIRCTRSMTGCVTNGAMYEANVTRNCGYNNSACAGGGAQHDIVFFAIAIGQDTHLSAPQQSLDANAKCLLARMANATDIFNAATGVTETMVTVCNNKFTTIDNDTHADLVEAWPCGTGPCIDAAQEKGKVYIVDVTGNVTEQLELIFQEIASILKLRLVL